jgi:hypothetical protein
VRPHDASVFLLFCRTDPSPTKLPYWSYGLPPVCTSQRHPKGRSKWHQRLCGLTLPIWAKSIGYRPHLNTNTTRLASQLYCENGMSRSTHYCGMDVGCRSPWCDYNLNSHSKGMHNPNLIKQSSKYNR